MNPMLIRRAFLLMLLLGLLAAGGLSARAQGSTGPEYFAQTGHNLQGDFLKFYHAIPDPTSIYGYPITEEFNGLDGLHVQYFQRARFELHPELPEGGRVVLTDLGRQLYSPGVQLNSYNPLACRIDPDTKYPVCYAFLDFLDHNGGTAQLGRPISPFEYRDAVIVQYFEKARLEWRPSNPEGQRVILADLGRIYFDRLGEDPGRLQAASPTNGAPSAVIALRVRAFTWKALTFSNDRQVLYVIVQDQRQQAVSDANCSVVTRWPDGQNESSAGVTDGRGIAIIPLSVRNQPPGNLAYLEVNCMYNGLAASVRTSFRIWY